MRYQITLYNIYSEKFTKNILCQYIQATLLDQSQVAIYQQINNYLKANYKISLQSLIIEICKNLFFEVKGTKTYIFLNPASRDSRTHLKLETLAQLVDDGNREIHGTRFFTKGFSFISSYLSTYFLIYAAKNSKEKGEQIE